MSDSLFLPEEITELRIWTAEKSFQHTDFDSIVTENYKNKIEKMKKICMHSTLVTSSADKSLILWNFLFTSVKETDKSNTEIKVFPYYLMPNPCRKFRFSDSPSHGICFPIKSISNSNSSSESAGNEKCEQLWQINAIVNSRTLTVAKNIQNNLFNSQKLSEIFPTGATDGKTIERKIHENTKNNSELKDIFFFSPVTIPIKNVQKTAELFLKRKFQNSGQSVSVLRTWTANSKTSGIVDDSRGGYYFTQHL